MMETLKRLVRDDDGATMVEYGLMVALIAVVALLAVTNLGQAVNSTFEKLVDTNGNGPVITGTN